MNPFIIWFQHRSGSTHLVSLLNSHPEIKCKGEVFGCIQVGDPSKSPEFPDARTLGDRIYTRILNQFPGRYENPSETQCLKEFDNFFSEHGEYAGKIRGFKFKFPSQAGLYPEITRQLESQSDRFRIIILRRDNLLRRALSVLNLQSVREKSNRANVDFELSFEPQTFNPAEVVRLIRYYQTLEPAFTAWPKQFENRIEIEYEDLINQQEKTCDRILNFLGTREKPPLMSRTRKIAPTNLQELVQNHDELIAVLNENKIAHQ